jgi:hypothetical protein
LLYVPLTSDIISVEGLGWGWEGLWWWRNGEQRPTARVCRDGGVPERQGKDGRVWELQGEEGKLLGYFIWGGAGERGGSMWASERRRQWWPAALYVKKWIGRGYL